MSELEVVESFRRRAVPYMVEKWEGRKPVELIYGGNRLEQAHAAFDAIVKNRPRGRYTLRQRAHVLRKWPDEHW
jgi:hypothetical protein